MPGPDYSCLAVSTASPVHQHFDYTLHLARNRLQEEGEQEELCEDDQECQREGGDFRLASSVMCVLVTVLPTRCEPASYQCLASYGPCEDTCECVARKVGVDTVCTGTLGGIGMGKVCLTR